MIRFIYLAHPVLYVTHIYAGERYNCRALVTRKQKKVQNRKKVRKQTKSQKTEKGEKTEKK